MTAPSPFAIAAQHYSQPVDPVDRYATPGEMAVALDPTTIQTPALELIDRILVDVAEGRKKRVIISFPPQEGKSQRVSRRYTLWTLLRNPDTRIAIASFSHGRARRWGRAVRNDIYSHGKQLGLSIAGDAQAADDWQLSGHEGGIYCTGIGGSLTGQPVDLMIIDDPVKDRKQADSEVYREDAWDWWTDVVLTRLAPGAPVVIILTRWHEDDLAGRLLSQPNADRWHVVNIPAVADHHPEKGETDPLGREPGEWMISARRDPDTGAARTDEEWEAKRVEEGTRTFTSLYQGRPSPEAGDVWQRDWWRRYETPLWSVQADGSMLVEADRVIQSWDMAFKDKKSSDWVVGQVWAQRGAQAFLLDQVRGRMSFTTTLGAVRLLTAKWPQATAKVVEDKANGTAVIDTLKTEIGGIVPENPTDSKYGRATAVAAFIEAGNVLLPSERIALFDVEGLIDEAAAFPNGTHDDQVDTTSQALNRLLLQRRKGPRMSFAGRAAPARSQVTVDNVA
jgi:predicted phage terminase large subunit-like protein